jgi:RNA polymerase sigma factor (sigma-70 family)
LRRAARSKNPNGGTKKMMNFSAVTNQDLYQMCLRGDESAWGYLYNYVLTIARSPRFRLREAPEDMAQSIVCHLLDKGIDRLQDHRAFRSFVRRVAVNLILDSFKKKDLNALSLDAQTDDACGPRSNPASGHPGPEDMTMGVDLVDTLREEMEKLPEKCRDVLNHYVDYKLGRYGSYKELAAKIGKSIGTLSSQVKRCLDILRAARPLKVWLGA